MLANSRRFEPEEFARRGDAIYHRDVTPALKPDDHGKIVAIDIDSGEWEIDASEIDACDRLEKRRPNAQIWIVRVGSRIVRRLGAKGSDRETVPRLALDAQAED